MKFSKPTRWIFTLCCVILALSACTPQPAASPAPVTPSPPTVTAEAAAPAALDTPTLVNAAPILKTKAGDLVYKSARFVQEVNGVTPAKNRKLLLVILERSDQARMDLQSFQDAHMQIFIQGEDGSNTLSTMGGWVGQEFAIGFQVPDQNKTYTLAWEDNPPFVITPD